MNSPIFDPVLDAPDTEEADWLFRVEYEHFKCLPGARIHSMLCRLR